MMLATLSAPDNNVRIGARQQGFTLIEALIALVVLTVGIMGIIALLLMSKNALHQSNQRTLAVNLADAMIERIRINPLGTDEYDDHNPLGGGSLSTPDTDCTVTECNEDQLAEFDLWSWEQALDGETVDLDGAAVGGLIDPHACITFIPQDGMDRSGTLSVTIQWRGLTKSTDAVDEEDGVTCGDGEDAGEHPYRRQVVVNTIVIDETDF